ncbi:hypothetical protein BDV98DRAFT_582516 [Pterulicium gracile]|uniref:Uncharacterized protein n=1 Tax=Pterulicium gracile TaxID=1884261 RepID=A0A5C3QNX0_9AGAR|nr:hypothetical protein BDV98DRAFT_582516 [Pterula gracilis]
MIIPKPVRLTRFSNNKEPKDAIPTRASTTAESTGIAELKSQIRYGGGERGILGGGENGVAGGKDGSGRARTEMEMGLEEINMDLEETKAELEETKTDLEETKTNLEETQAELEEIKTDLEETKTELEQMKEDFEQMKVDFEKMKVLLKRVASGKGAAIDDWGSDVSVESSSDSDESVVEVGFEVDVWEGRYLTYALCDFTKDLVVRDNIGRQGYYTYVPFSRELSG